MKPIAPPFIIKNGIAVFFPVIGKAAALVTLEIYYTRSNPIFSWLNCDTAQSKIWSKSIQQSPTGTLFLYETDKDLPLGFYTIAAKLNRASSSTMSGQITVGVITPTPRLIIGLPYSIYPPIDLA